VNLAKMTAACGGCFAHLPWRAVPGGDPRPVRKLAFPVPSVIRCGSDRFSCSPSHITKVDYIRSIIYFDPEEICLTVSLLPVYKRL